MLPLPLELMTIRELKAHLDRRFDRLERTKADRTELRRLAAQSDRRWAATKRAFKRFATKDDLRRFATKDDLKRFATKDDFKRFATKDDLRRFAAKDDLRGLATKADLARLEERVIALHKTLQNMLPHHGRILDDHERRIVDLEQGG